MFKNCNRSMIPRAWPQRGLFAPSNLSTYFETKSINILYFLDYSDLFSDLISDLFSSVSLGSSTFGGGVGL